MNTKWITGSLLLLLVLSVALAGGCTNSEKLSSGVSPVQIEVQLVDSDTRFGRAGFDLQQLAVRPLDPDAADALGTAPLGLLNTASEVIFVDYNAATDLYEADAPLTVGPYMLEAVTLGNMDFSEGTRISDLSCDEYIIDYPFVPGPVTVTDFGGDVVLQIRLDGESRFRIIIEGGNLVTAFENNWNCQQRCPGTCAPPLNFLSCTSNADCQGFPCIGGEPACIKPFNPTQFNSFGFAAEAPNYIAFP
jgi:hypothetical protein